MSTPPPPPPLASLIAALLECACQALNDIGQPVCGCCVWHGLTLPMDGCDCPCDGADGRLTLRVASVGPAPSNTLPQPASGPCGTPMVQAVIELGVFRCVTVPDPQASGFDCESAAVEAFTFLADEAALRQAVRCCPVERIRGLWQLTDSLWAPVGPEAGCAGGVLTVIAQGLNHSPKPREGR